MTPREWLRIRRTTPTTTATIPAQRPATERRRLETHQPDNPPHSPDWHPTMPEVHRYLEACGCTASGLCDCHREAFAQLCREDRATFATADNQLRCGCHPRYNHCHCNHGDN
jgi:hypothetical protein